MASYTKIIDLIVKHFGGRDEVTTSTITIPPNQYGYFHFDKEDIPLGKTITKVDINIYCRTGNGQETVLDIFMPQGKQLRGVILNSGWNNVVANDIDVIRRVNFSPRIDIGNDYNNTRDIEIYTHNSNYKPYIVITYEDTNPYTPSGLYPNNTTVSARGEIKFSWNHRSEEKTQQKEFTLQHSIDNGFTWETISQTTSNQYYDMPANTLPLNGKILWRVKTKDQNNLESPYTNNIEFNTAVVPQKPPILIQPLTGYLDGSGEILFEWDFVGGTAEDKQNKYDLQYSINQGDTWTTITETDNISKHTLPANTFQSGNIYWRVRTYNEYGDVSPYSEIGSFSIINSPPLPQIRNVTNSGRPEITWISTEQQIYEIEIFKDDNLIYSTGKIPSSSDRKHKVENYLKDGNYIAKLRITNEYDLNSPWAEYNFTLSTVKPPRANIEVFSSEYSNTIRGYELGPRNLVYRDNICIGEMKGNIFIDYTGENKKEYKYFIRTVDEEDNFSDSEEKIGKCNFKGNTLALASKPDKFIKLNHRINSIPRKNSTVRNDGSLVYFDGRKYPVVEFTEFKEQVKNLSFTFRTREELEGLIKLIDRKETLLYRDETGENIYGIIFYIDSQKNIFGYDVDFTITKTSDAYD